MNALDVSIMLDEESFRCLVRGGILHVGHIRIALADIGFDKMDEAIALADAGVDIYKEHHKED